MSAKASSAVGSITGWGVFVTRMPRSLQASRSILLYPAPKLAIIRRFGIASIICRDTLASKVLTKISASCHPSSFNNRKSLIDNLLNPSWGNDVVNAIFIFKPLRLQRYCFFSKCANFSTIFYFSALLFAYIKNFYYLCTRFREKRIPLNRQTFAFSALPMHVLVSCYPDIPYIYFVYIT